MVVCALVSSTMTSALGVLQLDDIPAPTEFAAARHAAGSCASSSGETWIDGLGLVEQESTRESSRSS